MDLKDDKNDYKKNPKWTLKWLKCHVKMKKIQKWSQN